MSARLIRGPRSEELGLGGLSGRRAVAVIAAVALLLGGGIAGAPLAAAAEAVFVVTSTGDAGDDATRANCATGSGVCTLRAAILQANAHPNDPSGPDQIVFDIPGPAPHVVALTTSLPRITDPVVIDAGLPAAGSPRRVELTGVGCFLTTSAPCDGINIAADDTTVRGLAVNGLSAGIRAQGGAVLRGLVIEGNYVGTNAAGDQLVPHPTLRLDQGIYLESVSDSRIGGDPALGAGNVVAGFFSRQIEAQFVTRSSFVGNRIGTNASGTVGLGGNGAGLFMSRGGENVIGAPGSGNVASGLHLEVIVLSDSPNNLIQSNRIGTNADGDAVIANGGTGLQVRANGTVIGGSPDSGNVISGNGRNVISLGGTAISLIGDDSEVSYNVIGTDVGGVTGLGNGGDGLNVHGDRNFIAHNVIAASSLVSDARRGHGINIQFGSESNRVEGNLIGLGRTGGALGNDGIGIQVPYDAFVGGGNVIGGPGQANEIAYNGLAGVSVNGFATTVDHPPGNTIRGNSIHDNGDPGTPSLGIDLSTAGRQGPDGIDPLDADDGANEQQNAPEITDVTLTADGAGTVITGQLRSVPGEAFVLDFYDNDGCDDTGYGEGQRYVEEATTTVPTAPEGSPTVGTAAFTITIPETITSPRGLAATATNENGSTSEFSACRHAPEAPLAAATRTTYTGDPGATYSDPITLSGRLENNAGTGPVAVAGKQLDFTLDEQAPRQSGPTGVDGSASVTPFQVLLTPGPTTVVTAFAGDNGYTASSDSDPITVSKEDCTLDYTGDALVAPLAPTRLAAQFGENDAYPGDWSGKTVTFTVTDSGMVPTTHTAITDAAGAAAVAVPLNAGVYGVAVSFTGDAFYQSCRAPDATVTVQAPTPAATRTTYTGLLTATYSDPITLSGRLEDTSRTNPVPIPGKQLDLTLGGMSTVRAAPTGSDGSASAKPFPVIVTPGPATVVTAFTGDAGYAASSDTDQITVAKEDCTLTYTGDTLVPPLAQTHLSAQFGEKDSYPGAWAGKSVTFTLTDAAMAISRHTAATDSSGVAALTVPLNASVYGVTVSFTGDAFYQPCNAETDILVTAQAAAAKVTGGGWFSNTAGRTSFGFNAIPQTDGSVKGQLQVRSNSGKNTFHGNTVASLTAKSGNTVRWTGTGRWNLADGYTFAITVVDNGSSGAKRGDTIDLLIYRTGDPTHPVYSSNGPQTLKGGNITVH